MSVLDGDFPLTAEYLAPILMDMPQAECPLYHRFGPSLYIRELHMKACTLAIGHIQKFEHVNIMLKGKVLMINEDDTTQTLEAPLYFIGGAGSRKVGLVLEDVVWQNIYATNETDIDTSETIFLDKVSIPLQLPSPSVAIDNLDYLNLLTEINMTEEEVQEQVQVNDLVDFDTVNTLRLATSAIHGKGVFTTAPLTKDEYIAKGRINNCRTIAGRYTNHSKTPNCKMVFEDGGDVWLVALDNISGCLGGGKGTELTVNYRDVLINNPKLIKGN